MNQIDLAMCLKLSQIQVRSSSNSRSGGWWVMGAGLKRERARYYRLGAHLGFRHTQANVEY